MGLFCCKRDGGRPSGMGLHDHIPNPWQAAAIKSRGSERCQEVWIMKTNASELLLRCR
jgi:hypothetical protein